MKVLWSERSKSDLNRLFDYLVTVDEDVAAGVIQMLVAAGLRLGDFPRLGQRWTGFNPREVRSIVVGHYELLYEVRDDSIQIARVYHDRQHRPFRTD